MRARCPRSIPCTKRRCSPADCSEIGTIFDAPDAGFAASLPSVRRHPLPPQKPGPQLSPIVSLSPDSTIGQYPHHELNASKKQANAPARLAHSKSRSCFFRTLKIAKISKSVKLRTPRSIRLITSVSQSHPARCNRRHNSACEIPKPSRSRRNRPPNAFSDV